MFRIHAEFFYDEFTVREMGIPEDVLEEARGKEGLRHKVIGGVNTYKGQWLLEWLEKTPEVANQ